MEEEHMRAIKDHNKQEASWWKNMNLNTTIIDYFVKLKE